jgi:hypothetical protein
MINSPDARNAVTTGQVLVDALARQAWDELAACLDDAVQFRALIPRGLRSADTRAAAAGYFQKWFGDADQIILLASEVEVMHDTLHITYRFREHEDQWYIVEQHAFCVVENGTIKQIDLLCSGFRPEAPLAS